MNRSIAFTVIVLIVPWSTASATLFTYPQPDTLHIQLTNLTNNAVDFKQQSPMGNRTNGYDIWATRDVELLRLMVNGTVTEHDVTSFINDLSLAITVGNKVGEWGQGPVYREVGFNGGPLIQYPSLPVPEVSSFVYVGIACFIWLAAREWRIYRNRDW